MKSKLLILLLLLSICQSCTDFLVENPRSVLNPVNFYTDETGFSPHFKLHETAYRLLFFARNYDSLSVFMNFNATDIQRRILIPQGADVNYYSNGNSYFLCVVLNRSRKNKGVHIVPQKGIKR